MALKFNLFLKHGLQQIKFKQLSNIHIPSEGKGSIFHGAATVNSCVKPEKHMF